jgi:hypothetical protein
MEQKLIASAAATRGSGSGAFLSGDARREEFQAILRDARERYSVALEKLADL